MTRPNTLKLLAALLCGGLLSLGSAAEARDDGRWKHGGKGWERQHDKHPGHRHTVVRERVVIHKYAPERPRYRSPRVIHHHHYGYAAPYPGYGYAYREPSIVISLPPVVIPLR